MTDSELLNAIRLYCAGIANDEYRIKNSDGEWEVIDPRYVTGMVDIALNVLEMMDDARPVQPPTTEELHIQGLIVLNTALDNLQSINSKAYDFLLESWVESYPFVDWHEDVQVTPLYPDLPVWVDPTASTEELTALLADVMSTMVDSL